jgi:hypothetical protein
VERRVRGKALTGSAAGELSSSTAGTESRRDESPRAIINVEPQVAIESIVIIAT